MLVIASLLVAVFLRLPDAIVHVWTMRAWSCLRPRKKSGRRRELVPASPGASELSSEML